MANKQQNNHIWKNLVKLSSKLEEFRVSEEFADVTITCDGESFKCHRVILAAASNFFRAMFREKNFVEGKTSKVDLKSATPSIFKETLNFIYTGDVEVTATNVNGLLEASEYFELGGVEERCIEFIKEYKISISNTLDMFVFACRTEKKVLIDILSKDIAEQMQIFSRTDQFLELSSDDLSIIVKQWSLLPVRKDELLFGAIVRWIFYRRKERSQFFDEFFKVIKFENLKSEYMKFIVKELVTYQPNHAAVVKIIKPVGCNTTLFPVMSRGVLQNAEKKLNVFVRCDEKNTLEVFSVKNTTECSPSDFFSSSEFFSSSIDSKGNQWIRSVALDDSSLYCLKYARRSAPKKKENKIQTKQSFHVYTLIDMRVNLALKSPPLIFDDVCMCPLESNIYLYNRTLSSQSACLESVASFTNEELERGIYVYNCELDRWFPVPAMKKLLRDSCMTELNGTLYLFGGIDSNDGNYSGYAQAYDYRVGQWQPLPKSSAMYDIGADCCSINEKIYVCGGKNNTNAFFERYDPVAGKWEGRRACPVQMYYHQAISYSNKLWTMGNYVGESSANNLTIRLYDPLQDTWSTLDGKEMFNLTSGTILSSEVFSLL